MTARQRIRRGVRIAGFGGLTATMLPAFLAREALTPAASRGPLRERWVGTWCSGVLGLFGVEVLRSGPLPAPGRGHLVVANHRSTADVLALLRAFGGLMVSRADLARWPLLGLGARAVGTLFVDRADAHSGATVVRMIRSRLVEGATVIVFPEGTTFPDDDVRPFHAGAFAAALRSGADVIPVGLAYSRGSGAQFVNESFGAHLARMAAATPSKVAMCVGAAIAVADGAKAAPLRDLAHAEVQRLVHEARRVVDSPSLHAT
ncbi:MAG TPA: lysophospholipid acyltransferase family protein [Polyangiaceae bacterium]|nr:lysophospholipid acyltransferase family protein [Polyangiaceae bacterium]